MLCDFAKHSYYILIITKHLSNFGIYFGLTCLMENVLFIAHS